MTALAVLLAEAEAAAGWMPGSGLAGLISAVVAGGVGGGGLVALVLVFWGLRHLKDKDDAHARLVEAVAARNTVLLVEIKAILEKKDHA